MHTNSGARSFILKSVPLPQNMCDSRRQPIILCIGRDWRLLETRGLVLKKLTPHVTVSDSEGLQTLQADFDIVLLCHSLKEEQAQSCMAFIRARWSKARIVRLVIGAANDLSQEVAILSTNPAPLLQGLWKITSQLGLTPFNGIDVEVLMQSPGEARALASRIF